MGIEVLGDSLYIITDGISRLCFCAVKNTACYLYNNKTKNTVVCSKLFKGIWEFWFILIMYGHPISCQNISWKK